MKLKTWGSFIFFFFYERNVIWKVMIWNTTFFKYFFLTNNIYLNSPNQLIVTDDMMLFYFFINNLLKHSFQHEPSFLLNLKQKEKKVYKYHNYLQLNVYLLNWIYFWGCAHLEIFIIAPIFQCAWFCWVFFTTNHVKFST